MNFDGIDNLKERWPQFQAKVRSWNLRHFSADEFILLRTPWEGPEYYPPHPALADNLKHTAHLADEIRHKWGSPVKVISGYRPPMYNDKAIEGSDSSMHVICGALDLRPVGEFDLQEWISHVEGIVAEKRRHDAFSIGLGRYWEDDDRFIHIDTGYYTYNRNWHIPQS